MQKVGRPRGLIRWDTFARQQAFETKATPASWRPLRPRTLLYALLLSIVALVMLGAFLLRTDTELTVQRDRSPNFVRLTNGDIRNSYTVKVLNKSREVRHFRLQTDGQAGAVLGFVGAEVEGQGNDARLTVHPDAVGTFRVFLTVPSSKAPSGSKSIEFSVRDDNGRRRASHDAVFVGPAR
jgi:polyferredoxin